MELVHERGLLLKRQAYLGPFDELRMARSADVPGVEFWFRTPPIDNACLAGSLANPTGRRIVEAEAFTDAPPTSRDLHNEDVLALKRRGDLMFARGVNRFELHGSVHQPSDDPAHRIGFWQFGTKFDRHHPDFKSFKPWIAYLSRAQFLLQQGRGVADVLYLADGPSPAKAAWSPELPFGWKGDCVDPEFFAREAVRTNGVWRFPCGMTYRVLVRPGMTAQALADALAATGVPPDFSARENGCPVDPSEIAFTHRKCGKVDVYFVANLTERGRRLTASFRAKGRCEVWNAWDGADGRDVPPGERFRKNSSGADSYTRKSVTYRRKLPVAKPGKRYFLRFGGASIVTTAAVNDSPVGRHTGAFTAFVFEITEAMRTNGVNDLEVVVDNRYRREIPPVNADFTMYGGLYRGVSLIETDRICINPLSGGSGVRIEADAKTGAVVASVSVLGGTNEIRRFRFADPKLWSPETPNLYSVDIRIDQGGCRDFVTESFGFRTVEFRSDGFYLNGRRRKLRGVNRHQDRRGRGWALSAADDEVDISLLKEMGADAVRTAHYPQSDRVYSLCDRMGLLAWCETPCVNGLVFTPEFREEVWRETREMVDQLGNHPSIFCWSIFNELYNKVPMTEGEPEAMMEELRDYVKALDPSRPVASASDQVAKKRLNLVTEVLGFNRYPGWYGGTPADMSARVDEIFAKNPSLTTLALSEYGAGGDVATQADALVPCLPKSDVHTEGYQAFVHVGDYRALSSDPRVWGTFVWCMYDFGSDCRLEGRKWGRNDKGLVAFDHKTKKAAWHFYHANWTAEPELHLVKARGGHQTTNETLNVLGFSNLGDVELVVNGRRAGVKTPDAVKTVLWRDVPLALGRNVVELKAGGRRASGVWTRIPALNYDPAKVGEVKLEDPLAFADGRRVASAADWPARRREILDLFQREMYGRMPSPIEPVVDLVDEGVTMGGYAIRRQLKMHFKADRSGPCVNWLVLEPRYPRRKGAPVLLFLNYGGNHELLKDDNILVPTCWMRKSPEFGRFGERATAATRGLYADPNLRTVYPVGMILARGFAVATACYSEISFDKHGRILDGKYAADDVLSLFPYDPKRTDNPTALGAWAWTLCRAMDMIETLPRLDAKRVTVLGSSRLAKAALVAGAFDERFYAVVPNQTGGGGCPLLKRNYGENVEALMRNFPHWFCSDFGKYAGREKEMPFDSHLLMACVAPRKLLVEGFDDPFYDTEGEFEALKAASPVWTFLGRPGLPRATWPAAYDVSAIGADIGYVHRTERHGLSAYDWTWIMDFAEGKGR